MVNFISATCILVLVSVALLLSGCGVDVEVAEKSAVLEKKNILCSNNSAATTELLTDLPAPDRRKGIGNAHLQVTTEQQEVQYWFDQGLNYLHGFGYLEAYRAFKQVVAIDPYCAMGYWGVAMCQPGFGGDDFTVWQTAIDRASSLAGHTSAVEQGLISALRVTAHEGLLSAKGSWQALAETYKDEPEVVAFASIMMRQVAENDQDSDLIKAILEEALLQFPDHIGLLHYYVHLMEVRPDYGLARSAVEKLVQVAPNNSHLTHMPGHLHYLDGDYEAAVRVFERARTQEQAYHKEQGIPPALDQNYLHNLHYLSVAYCELNKRDHALIAAKQFASTTLRREAPIDGAGWMLLYEGRILPALVHIRFGEYKDAAKEIGFWLTTPVVPLENKVVREYLSAIQHYCFAMDFALKGERQRSFDYADQMVVHFNRFSEFALSGPTEHTMATQAFQVMTMLRYELAGWLNNMDPEQPFDEEHWRAAQTAEEVAESQARLHLHRGEPIKARKALNAALEKRPKSVKINNFFSTI